MPVRHLPPRHHPRKSRNRCQIPHCRPMPPARLLFLVSPTNRAMLNGRLKKQLHESARTALPGNSFHQSARLGSWTRCFSRARKAPSRLNSLLPARNHTGIDLSLRFRQKRTTRAGDKSKSTRSFRVAKCQRCNTKLAASLTRLERRKVRSHFDLVLRQFLLHHQTDDFLRISLVGVPQHVGHSQRPYFAQPGQYALGPSRNLPVRVLSRPLVTAAGQRVADAAERADGDCHLWRRGEAVFRTGAVLALVGVGTAVLVVGHDRLLGGGPRFGVAL